jgi:hypothetical protein
LFPLIPVKKQTGRIKANGGRLGGIYTAWIDSIILRQKPGDFRFRPGNSKYGFTGSPRWDKRADLVYAALLFANF